MELNEIVQEIDPDSKIKHSCIHCGECCNRVKTNCTLTILDIYKMAKYLNMDIEAFLNEYCEMRQEKPFSYIATLSKKNGKCPFQTYSITTKEYGCKLPEDSRSVYCTSYPIVPIRVQENGKIHLLKFLKCKNDGPKEEHNPMKYAGKISKECHDAMDKILEMKSHLSEIFPIEHFMRMALAFLQLPEKMHGTINKVLKTCLETEKENLTENMKDFSFMVITRLTELEFIDYDINKPLIPQIENNKKEMEEVAESTSNILKYIFKELEAKHNDFDVEEFKKIGMKIEL